MDTILVLFIAHEGITQPDVWKLWKTMMPLYDVRFHVVCPNDPKYGTDLCMEHQLSVMGKTSWGSFSIVYETIKALCKISRLYRTNERWKRTFIVSGYDIPIRNLDTMKFREKDEIVSRRDIGNYFTHSQWMCLTAPFVNYISDRYTDHHDLMLELFHDCLLLNLQNPSLAPDELWLNFVGWNKKYFSRQYISLPTFHDNLRPISPIQWKDLRLKQYVNTGDGSGYRINLIQAIYRSRESECTFERKISPHVVFPREFLIHLFLDKDLLSGSVQHVDPSPSHEPTPQRPAYQKKQQHHRARMHKFFQIFADDFVDHKQQLHRLGQKSNFDQDTMIASRLAEMMDRLRQSPDIVKIYPSIN